MALSGPSGRWAFDTCLDLAPSVQVPDSVAERIKQAAGDAAVSAWVTGVIEAHLDDAELEREWERFYRDVAPYGAAERRADSLFKRLTKPRRRTAA